MKQVRFHAVTLTAQGKHDNSGNLLKGRRSVAPHRARSGPACSWLDQRLPLQASLIGSRLMATCGLRVNRSVSATRASRPLYPRKQTLGDTSSMSAFLIGRSGQALSDYPPPLQCRCRSRARASLRNRHQGPSIMGVEGDPKHVSTSYAERNNLNVRM